MENLSKYAATINKNAKDKGFWETENTGEKLMLVICELAEAVEAIRDDKRINPEHLQTFVDKEIKLDDDEAVARYMAMFETFFKDKYEDELADAMIRALDICEHYGIKITESFRFSDQLPAIIERNLSEAILFIGGWLFTAYGNYLTLYHAQNLPDLIKYYINQFISDMVYFCRVQNIDLETHVMLKMLYNQYRPYKHNKKY